MRLLQITFRLPALARAHITPTLEAESSQVSRYRYIFNETMTWKLHSAVAYPHKAPSAQPLVCSVSTVHPIIRFDSARRGRPQQAEPVSGPAHLNNIRS